MCSVQARRDMRRVPCRALPWRRARSDFTASSTPALATAWVAADEALKRVEDAGDARRNRRDDAGQAAADRADDAVDARACRDMTRIVSESKRCDLMSWSSHTEGASRQGERISNVLSL